MNSTQPTAFENKALNQGHVGQDVVHESAHLHVTGTAPYIDDLPELQGTLHIALGLSPVAHGDVTHIDLSRLKAQPGVVAVLTAADIPGVNDCGPILHDDPILAAFSFTGGGGADGLDGGRCEGVVHYLGQPVFAVVATERRLALRAAALAKEVITVAAKPALLTARQAHAAQAYVIPPLHLARGDAPAALAGAPHRLKGSQTVGGQEQFYLEGQIAYALPQEDGAMRVLCSTQHPTEMQHVIAHALGVDAHKVAVECRRMGGGFGGKESQSALFAAVASVAAVRLNRPVKLRVDRDDDFMITGRRHGFEYDWDVGFDDHGRILGLELTLITNAGFSTDLTPPVMTRALCHVDNAYWLPNVSMHGYCARTNTQSNTAFRGFGGPQGAIITEIIVQAIARHLGLDPLAVRQANFYGTTDRNVTPYGQTVSDNVIEPLVAQLANDCDYAGRRAEIAQWNRTSPVLKRGLALTPVKFGISFNVAHFNQAGALVHVYTDGSVLVNHGGTEMGQGLNTKVAQVVATELGIPVSRVRCTATDTSKVANTSATAASTGADLNGKAAQDAAQRIKQRLTTLAASLWQVPEEQVRFDQDRVSAGAHAMPFCELVTTAYLARVQLWSDGHYATPGLHWDRERLQGHPFYYFAYGAACSEVVIDTLTGEMKVLRADVLHDVGRSLNPAIDIGQIEGAFVQGMGWLTTEALWWHPESGKLMTHAPSTYKIPTANDVPHTFNVRLYDNANAVDAIHRSKAVGEPPLLLPISVFLAVQDAVAATARDPRQPVVLSAPATAEAVLAACDQVSTRTH